MQRALVIARLLGLADGTRKIMVEVQSFFRVGREACLVSFLDHRSRSWEGSSLGCQ